MQLGFATLHPEGMAETVLWSAVPSGLIARRSAVPNVETGYYRKSLRDKDLSAFCECLDGAIPNGIGLESPRSVLESAGILVGAQQRICKPQHAFGVLGFFLLVLTTMFVPFLYRKLSRKLEIRADCIAKSNEPDSGAYAQALARLHEDNLAPAVMLKERMTHPNLYDRLLAAGVTPDFPRPAPAQPGFPMRLQKGARATPCFTIFLNFSSNRHPLGQN
jgi:hypothetical protein